MRPSLAIRNRVLAPSVGLSMLVAACGGNEGTGPIRAASVVIQPDSISLDVGVTHQLAASVRDAKGVALTERAVVWGSADGAMASVSPTGLVTARAPGRVIISATSEGKIGQAVIRIATVPVASLVILPESASTAVGRTVVLSATTRAANGNLLFQRQVTWTSSDAATATVSSNGLVTAMMPGWVVITATSEEKSDSTVVGITRMPDFSIVDAHITQGVQAGDGSIPLVLGGTAAVVNVVMRTNVQHTQAMQVVFRLFDAGGALVRADTVTKQGGIDLDPGYDTPDAQFLIPASALAAGQRWQVVRDPKIISVDDSSANDVFPRTGTAALATVTVAPLEIRFVPIVLSAHAGETGAVSSGLLPEYVRVVKSVHPLGSVTPTIGDPFSTTASFGSPPRGGESPFWLQVLAELDVARIASDAPSAHWYGVVVPPAGFNYTTFGGFGYIPAPGTYDNGARRTALGVQIGWFSDAAQARELVAHELGHNFGRRHAPCGNPANPDPNYPYAGGLIGRVQHDVFSWATGRATSAVPVSSQVGDIMGYCARPWASEYTYRGVLAFRAPQMAVAAGSARAERTRVLIVRGTVEQGGSVRIDPVFAIDGHPERPQGGGSYRLEGRAADARVLFSYAFEPADVDHAPTVRQFLFAIPASPDLEAALAEVTVRGPMGTATLGRSPAAAAIRPGAPSINASVASPQRLAGGVSVSCADAATRGILVLDANSGEVRAMSSGSVVRVAVGAGTRLSVLCTDGIRTERASVIAP